jgi:hypothetical protein
MKMLTLLSAAFIAAGCTVAMAQGDNATKPGTKVDADKNPSAMNANPTAGNTAVKPKKAMHRTMKGMTTKPVSSTRMHHAKKAMPEARK